MIIQPRSFVTARQVYGTVCLHIFSSLTLPVVLVNWAYKGCTAYNSSYLLIEMKAVVSCDREETTLTDTLLTSNRY